MYVKHLIKALIVIFCMGVLTACNIASLDDNKTKKADATSQTETTIISTPRGDVEIPKEPKRIVTDGYLPELLLLDTKPIGSTQWDLENKVIQNQIEGITNTGERSLEVTVDLKPDLIITWVSDETILQQYEKIAPTLAIPYGSTEDIYETMRTLGEALNKKEQAENWIVQLDKTSAEARAKIAPFIQPEDTFSLMGVFVVDKGFYVYGDGAYRGGEAIYKHLQLKPPAKQAADMIGKEDYLQISYEVVPDYAGSYIFLDQGDLISEVWGEDEALWSSLEAVKNDHVFQLDPDLFWGNDPISLELQIKEIANIIAERQDSK